MFVSEHLRVSLGNREITPHGRTCLHTAGMGSINGLAGSLLDKRSQHIEGQRGILFQAVSSHSIKGIDEVARQNAREMHLTAYGRGGTIDPATQQISYALDLMGGLLVRSLNKERHSREIDPATSGEGLEGIEHTRALLAQHATLHAACRMHHNGALAAAQCHSYILNGTVAHGDDVEVGIGSLSHIVTPLARGQCRHLTCSLGVASHHLTQLQLRALAHGNGHRLGYIATTYYYDALYLFIH